ncbi:MAG: DUF4214 domain-containing protein [Ruthenibacterium sp.]
MGKRFFTSILTLLLFVSFSISAFALTDSAALPESAVSASLPNAVMQWGEPLAESDAAENAAAENETDAASSLAPAGSEALMPIPALETGGEHWDYYDFGVSNDAIPENQFFASSKPIAYPAVHNLVVFVRFADSPEFVDSARVANAMRNYNTLTPAGAATATGTLRDAVYRATLGTLDADSVFQGKTQSTSIQLSHPMGYYQPKSKDSVNGYETNERMVRENAFVTEVCAALEPVLPPDDFDTNRDNIVDSICFIYPAALYTNVNWNELLWPHQTRGSNAGATLRGLSVRNYVFLNMGDNVTGIFNDKGNGSKNACHEFMHNLGLPDLYRYNDSSHAPVEDWDLMASGDNRAIPIINAYTQREYLRCGTPMQRLTSSATVTLTDAGYADGNAQYGVILQGANSDEVFVAEYRKNQANGGLLVYRIDENKAENGNKYANPNSGGESDFMYVFRPQESGYNNANPAALGSALLSPENAGWSSIGRPLGAADATFKNTLYYADRTNSGIVIDALHGVGTNALTFQVTFSAPTPAYTPLEQFIVRLYRNCLERAPDDAGLATWKKQLQDKTMTGVQVAAAFFHSAEFQSRDFSDEKFLELLYGVAFDRGVDAGGLATWGDAMKNGVSRDFVLAGCLNSAEFKDICTQYGVVCGAFLPTEPRDQNLGLTTFVNHMYSVFLARNAEPDGLNTWTNQFLTNKLTATRFSLALISSQEFLARNLSDRAFLDIVYDACFARGIDASGLATWGDALHSGRSRVWVMEHCAASPEFRARAEKYGVAP